MKLRSLMLLGIAGCVTVSVVALAALLQAAREEAITANEQMLAQSTMHQASGLLILAHEYSQHAEPRAAWQWYERHKTIVKSLPSPRADDYTALRELRSLTNDLPDLFGKLEQTHDSSNTSFALRRRQLLLDQLVISNQALSDNASQWYEAAVTRRAAAERRFQVFAFVTPVVLLVTLLTVAFLAQRRVLTPLEQLGKATAAVADGDLSIKLGFNRNDELGVLAARFDKMTDELSLRTEQLYSSEKQLRAIADNVPVLISYVDTNHQFQYANKMYRYWLNMTKPEVAGLTVREVFGDELYEAGIPYLERAMKGERVEFQSKHLVGMDLRIAHTTFIPDYGDDGTVRGIYTLSTDVTATKHAERQLKALARSDALTGVANRLCFDELLPQAIARARRSGRAIALLFLDIDRFKQINDTKGHAAGDAVLKAFANTLKASVRGTDHVARLAGDEFVVILEGLRSSEDASTTAAKIVKAVGAPVEIEGEPLTVTTSVGCGYYDPDTGSITPDVLLAKADVALYEAKKAGRNTFRLAA